jgi:tetratricopeptide (TPR) repeat protein
MEKAIEDANRISRAAGSDAAVARTSAQAYAEMGQILEDAGEAEQAEMSYRRATSPLERLALAGPTKAKAALDLTVLQLRLTRLYLARGEAVAARRHFNDAERWLATLETDAGYSGHAPERLAYERWGLTMARADLLLAEGDAANASHAAATALGLTDAARRDVNPLFDDGARLASLAKVADCNVRSFEADGKDPARLQRALEVLGEAARVAEARVGSVVPPPQALVDLGVIESARGRVHLRAGGASEADAELRRAVDYFDRALAADPGRADWRRELLRALEASAAVAERLSREVDAERFRRRAAELRGRGDAGADAAASRNTAAPSGVPASSQDRR